MTVSELIEQLQTLPQELKVYISANKAKIAFSPKAIELIDSDEFVAPFIKITTSENQ